MVRLCGVIERFGVDLFFNGYVEVLISLVVLGLKVSDDLVWDYV